MNNIFLGQQDPLLAQYPQQPIYTYPQQIQSPQTQFQANNKNWVDELDNTLKSVPEDVIDKLSSNNQWIALNTELGIMIKEELMNLIRSRLINNPNVIENAKKQIELIHNIEKEAKEEERQNMNELNDYMRNYSHLTFDEYKKIKNKPNEN